MKPYLSTLSIILFSINSYTQDFEWVDRNGGTVKDQINGVTIDIDGNILVTGSFDNIADFDPDEDETLELGDGGGDIFVQKLAPDNDMIWTKVMLGSGESENRGIAIASDAEGNIYVVGRFIEDRDFDPGADTYTLVTPDEEYMDAFILKLDTDGNFVWVQQISGPGDDAAHSVTVDADGNVYVGGYFNGTADFDGGAGVFEMTATGESDAFLMKMTGDGEFIWAKQHISDVNGVVYGIHVDHSFSSYIVGSFEGDVDLDPGAGEHLVDGAGNKDIFIEKLNSDGEYVWAVSYGGIDTDIAYDLVVSGQEVYVTGCFKNTVDFNPGADTDILTAEGVFDAFVLKVEQNGLFAWVKHIGGSSVDTGHSIDLDQNGDVVSVGQFGDIVDMDTGDSVFEFEADGHDSYVHKLTPDGDFIWAGRFEGPLLNRALAVKVSDDNNIYVAGSFQGTVDFDPDVADTYSLESYGSLDSYVVKINQPDVSGIHENQSDKITVYPNPTTDKFAIDLTEIQSPVSVQVTDLNGRVVYNQLIDPGNVVSMGEDIPSGIYIITVRQEDQTQQFKLIKV